MAASIIAFRRTASAPIFGIFVGCSQFEFTFVIVSLLIEPSIKKKPSHKNGNQETD
jgi:hypothetical protein